MLGKIWKKVLLFILLIACLFNIVYKLINKPSMEEEIQASLNYVQEDENNQ